MRLKLFIIIILLTHESECQRGRSTARLPKKVNERPLSATSRVAATPSKFSPEPIYDQLKSTDDLMRSSTTPPQSQLDNDLILLLGNTGAGRTTIAHLLTADVSPKSRLDLSSAWAGDGFLIEDSAGSISKGNATLLTTSNFPNFKSNSNSQFPAVLDLAGFENTQGPPAELANALLNRNVSSRTTRVKILFVVNFSSVRTGESRIEFRNLIENAARFVKNPDNYASAIGLVVTKASGVDETSRDKILKNVANYVKNLRIHLEEVVAEEARRSVMENILDAFLVESGGKFERITIVPVPTESGLLRDMGAFQRAREELNNLLDKLEWADSSATDDWGLSLSERGLLFVQQASRALDDKVLDLLGSISNKLEGYFGEVIKSNSLPLGALYRQLQQLQNTSVELHSLESLEPRKQFFQIYANTLQTELKIETATIISDLDELSKIANRLDFLDSFASEEGRAFGVLARQEWITLIEKSTRAIGTKIYQVANKLNADVEGGLNQLMRTDLVGVYKSKIQKAEGDTIKQKELVQTLRQDAQKLSELVSLNEQAASINTFLNETITCLKGLEIGIPERLLIKLSKFMQEQDLDLNEGGQHSDLERPIPFKRANWVRHIEILLSLVRSERDRLDGTVRKEEQSQEVTSLKANRNSVETAQKGTLNKLKQRLKELKIAKKEAEEETLKKILRAQALGIVENERTTTTTTTTTTSTTTTEATTTIPTTTAEPFTTLYSPNVTSWGVWGEWEFCPSGTYVSGFQLKAQPQVQGDNTALNGIRLLCTKRNSMTLVKTLKSLEGPYGWWGQTSFCGAGSSAVGFQMLSEERQRSGDNTAANNLKLFCDNNWTFIGSGTSWGKWTKERRCPNGGLICGLKTQVDQSDSDDETGINNIAVKCCEH